MSRILDRSITPSAHLLASSGIGSARLQLSCSPCLADLYVAFAREGTDLPATGPPVTISFQATRAILLASATAANFGGLRLRRSTIQGEPRPPRRTCLITAVAPTTNTLRKASSPALVMTPSLTLPAVE